MNDVVIAVEDAIVRAGLVTILEGAPGVARVVAGDDPSQIPGMIAEASAPVLILDVVYRAADEDLCSRLAEAVPDLAVLVYVRHTALGCALRYLTNGAGVPGLSPDAARRLDCCCLASIGGPVRGCLGSDFDADEIRRAVSTAAEGKIAAAPWLAALGKAQLAQDNEPPGLITPRELEVMALLAKGMGNKQIASRMGIHVQTVKNHVASLMEKLDMVSRLEVGILASKLHLDVRGD